MVRECGAHEKPRDRILKVVHERRIDMLVMGFVGRKGPKDNSEQAGSTVEFLLREINSPVLIVKPQALFPKSNDESFKFVCAIDGHPTAYNAVRV